LDIFKLGEKILDFLEMVFGFWNHQASLVFSLLGQSPVDFKGGGPWGMVESVEPVFVAVGSSLVVLFFVIGFCSESIDIREDMRFEVILRMFIRLALAEWLVIDNVTIMKAFFTSIGNLVGLLSEGSYTTLSIDSVQADIIKNLGFGESLVMLVLAALLSIIVIICGFYPTPVASTGKMERSHVLLGRKKNGTVKKINSTGKMWSPDLEMMVLCSSEAMEQMGTEPKLPKTEEQRQLFTELISLDMKTHRLSPVWVEWLMGFPPGWTDICSGKKNQ